MFAMNAKWKRTLIGMIIVDVLCIAVFLLVLLLRNAYDVRHFSDACFVAAAVGLGGVALYWIGQQGVFDVLAYGMKRFLMLWVNKNTDKETPTAGAYHEAKMEKRRQEKSPIWPLFLLPALLFTAAIILLIVYKNI